MSDLPTPETDAVAEKNIYGVACKVDVDFTRKLERERDEARESLRTLAEHGESEIQRITKERDELREQLSAAKHFLEKYIAERDEAREELVISKKTIDRLVANLKIACETNYKYDLKQ